MSSQLIYPLRDYKRDDLINYIKNMNTFVRFNKTIDMFLSFIYKRVPGYESNNSILRVITLLHSGKSKLTKDEIISELEDIFNLTTEDATEEYENWVTETSGGKQFRGGEQGIELIMDLLGSNIMVDMSQYSYQEFKQNASFCEHYDD